MTYPWPTLMPMGIVVISCVRLSVQPSMGLGLCIAYKALGRNGLQFGMLMYPDGLHSAFNALVDTWDICCHYWQHILVQYGILPDMVLHGRSMYGHWMAYPQDEVTLAMFTNHKVFLISLFVDVELLVIWHVTMQHPGNHTTGIFMGCCKMLMWFHCNDDVRLTPLPWSSSFFTGFIHWPSDLIIH